MADMPCADNVPIKVYLEAQIEALKREGALIRELQDKALDKALTSMEELLKLINEIRGTLADQAGTFISKTEYHAVVDRIVNDVGELREINAELKGKASQNSVQVAYAIAGVGILFSLINSLVSLAALGLTLYKLIVQ